MSMDHVRALRDNPSEEQVERAETTTRRYVQQFEENIGVGEGIDFSESEYCFSPRYRDNIFEALRTYGQKRDDALAERIRNLPEAFSLEEAQNLEKMLEDDPRQILPDEHDYDVELNDDDSYNIRLRDFGEGNYPEEGYVTVETELTDQGLRLSFAPDQGRNILSFMVRKDLEKTVEADKHLLSEWTSEPGQASKMVIAEE